VSCSCSSRCKGRSRSAKLALSCSFRSVPSRATRRTSTASLVSFRAPMLSDAAASSA
jgi:hypothetical protein